MPVREQEYNGIPGLPVVVAVLAASGGLAWAMVTGARTDQPDKGSEGDREAHRGAADGRHVIPPRRSPFERPRSRSVDGARCAG